MHLILSDAPPMHWALAGSLLGAVSLALVFLANRRLGISSGFEDVCSLVLRTPYFTRKSLLEQRPWRLAFLGGLVIGGAVSAAQGNGWHTTWALGAFDQFIGWGNGGKIAWMFVGGVFIGFGTRLAGGCTSGHGIFGLANLELSSLATAMSYMAGGIITTNLIYRVIV